MLPTVIIPARLASTRFPEKVLARATGKPLVQHVVEGARKSALAGEVVVAADHSRIVDALKPFGTRVILTSPDHPNGTSRLAEACGVLGLPDDAVIVNAQGDEPEMAGDVIDAAVRALAKTDPGQPARSIGTAATPLRPDQDPANPNLVKVVMDRMGRAIMFSRAAIPFPREAGASPRVPYLRHIGVYAYHAGYLRRYAAMPPTPLELTEQLEQLRALEHGHEIGVEIVSAAPEGIDTPEQYEAFVQRYRG